MSVINSGRMTCSISAFLSRDAKEAEAFLRRPYGLLSEVSFGDINHKKNDTFRFLATSVLSNLCPSIDRQWEAFSCCKGTKETLPCLCNVAVLHPGLGWGFHENFRVKIFLISVAILLDLSHNFFSSYSISCNADKLCKILSSVSSRQNRTIVFCAWINRNSRNCRYHC